MAVTLQRLTQHADGTSDLRFTSSDDTEDRITLTIETHRPHDFKIGEAYTLTLGEGRLCSQITPIADLRPCESGTPIKDYVPGLQQRGEVSPAAD